MIFVRLTSRPGRDPKMFRAYRADTLASVGVSASTTGDHAYAVVKCAAKAFKKLLFPQGELDELETRVKKTETQPGQWLCSLQPKG